MAQTAACVDIIASNNATLADAFRFGTEGDTSWSFTGCTFEMEIKASRDDDTPLLVLTSSASEIIVDDVVQRVLHLNVTPVALRAALPVGEYVYDLLMSDDSTPDPIITLLMQGVFCLKQGVTEV
jgi:hypothetical protein